MISQRRERCPPIRSHTRTDQPAERPKSCQQAQVIRLGAAALEVATLQVLAALCVGWWPLALQTLGKNTCSPSSSHVSSTNKLC